MSQSNCNTTDYRSDGEDSQPSSRQRSSFSKKRTHFRGFRGFNSPHDGHSLALRDTTQQIPFYENPSSSKSSDGEEELNIGNSQTFYSSKKVQEKNLLQNNNSYAFKQIIDERKSPHVNNYPPPSTRALNKPEYYVQKQPSYGNQFQNSGATYYNANHHHPQNYAVDTRVQYVQMPSNYKLYPDQHVQWIQPSHNVTSTQHIQLQPAYSMNQATHNMHGSNIRSHEQRFTLPNCEVPVQDQRFYRATPNIMKKRTSIWIFCET